MAAAIQGSPVSAFIICGRNRNCRDVTDMCAYFIPADCVHIFFFFFCRILVVVGTMLFSILFFESMWHIDLSCEFLIYWSLHALIAPNTSIRSWGLSELQPTVRCNGWLARGYWFMDRYGGC